MFSKNRLSFEKKLIFFCSRLIQNGLKRVLSARILLVYVLTGCMQVYFKCGRMCKISLLRKKKKKKKKKKKSHTLAKVPFSKLEIWPGVPPYFGQKSSVFAVFSHKARLSSTNWGRFKLPQILATTDLSYHRFKLLSI